jgi:hypothetical protein
VGVVVATAPLGQSVTLFDDASGELVNTWTGSLAQGALDANIHAILAR